MRELPEWVGKTDDTKVPDRVQVRVREKADHKCQSCHRHLVFGERGEIDHEQELIAGGENREKNLQLLCSGCHRSKTKVAVAFKAYNYRRKLANAGIKRRKSRPMPGSRDSAWKITFSRGAVRR